MNRAIELIGQALADPTTLIVVGAYSIGKEKIYLTAAKRFGCKVCVDSHRMLVLTCQELEPSVKALLTTSEQGTRIHVISIGRLTVKQMNEYLRARPAYTRIVALKPSLFFYFLTKFSAYN